MAKDGQHIYFLWHNLPLLSHLPAFWKLEALNPSLFFTGLVFKPRFQFTRWPWLLNYLLQLLWMARPCPSCANKLRVTQLRLWTSHQISWREGMTCLGYTQFSSPEFFSFVKHFLKSAPPSVLPISAMSSLSILLPKPNLLNHSLYFPFPHHHI